MNDDNQINNERSVILALIDDGIVTIEKQAQKRDIDIEKLQSTGIIDSLTAQFFFEFPHLYCLYGDTNFFLEVLELESPEPKVMVGSSSEDGFVYFLKEGGPIVLVHNLDNADHKEEFSTIYHLVVGICNV